MKRVRKWKKIVLRMIVTYVRKWNIIQSEEFTGTVLHRDRNEIPIQSVNFFYEITKCELAIILSKTDEMLRNNFKIDATLV